MRAGHTQDSVRMGAALMRNIFLFFNYGMLYSLASFHAQSVYFRVVLVVVVRYPKILYLFIFGLFMQSWWCSHKGREYWAASRNIHERDCAWCSCSQPHWRPDDRCARPFECWQWRWPGWKEGLHRLPWQPEDAYLISAISYESMHLLWPNYWGKMPRKTTISGWNEASGNCCCLGMGKQRLFAFVVCMCVCVYYTQSLCVGGGVTDSGEKSDSDLSSIAISVIQMLIAS